MMASPKFLITFFRSSIGTKILSVGSPNEDINSKRLFSYVLNEVFTCELIVIFNLLV